MQILLPCVTTTTLAAMVLVQCNFPKWNQQCLLSMMQIGDDPLLTTALRALDHTSTIQERLINGARQYVQQGRDDCWSIFSEPDELPVRPDPGTTAMTIFVPVQEGVGSVTLLYNDRQLYAVCNQHAVAGSEDAFRLNSAVTFILVHAAAPRLFAFLQDTYGNGDAVREALSRAALMEDGGRFAVALCEGVVAVAGDDPAWDACIVLHHHKLVLRVGGSTEGVEFI